MHYFLNAIYIAMLLIDYTTISNWSFSPCNAIRIKITEKPQAIKTF